MRKNTIFISLVSFLAIMMSTVASAEITLTKPTETITISDLNELLKPETLKITVLPDGRYSVQFAYEGYIFEGTIPRVLSFETDVNINSETGNPVEYVHHIVLLEKYVEIDNIGNRVLVIFRLSAGYVLSNHNNLVRFFAPQTIKGIMHADSITYKNERSEQTLDIIVFPPLR